MRNMHSGHHAKIFTQLWLLGKIIGSFFIAFVYLLLVAPHLWAVLHIELVLIFLLFWHYAQRTYVGVISAWIVGLFVDLIFGSTLGVHAFLYALSIYIVQLFQTQFRYNTVLMQYLFVALLLLANAVVRLVILQASSLLLTTEVFLLCAQALLGAFVWILLTSFIHTR